MAPAQKIDALYLSAFSRTPSSTERQMATALLGARKGDVAGALQDVWWAVLNSNEFILVH
ncbi:MAG: hypothetical protein FJ284_13310 [Planctomycetes bacterium]|nr:hypothetical protein [Planctomycetota bacterium]